MVRVVNLGLVPKAGPDAVPFPPVCPTGPTGQFGRSEGALLRHRSARGGPVPLLWRTPNSFRPEQMLSRKLTLRQKRSVDMACMIDEASGMLPLKLHYSAFHFFPPLRCSSLTSWPFVRSIRDISRYSPSPTPRHIPPALPLTHAGTSVL